MLCSAKMNKVILNGLTSKTALKRSDFSKSSFKSSDILGCIGSQFQIVAAITALPSRSAPLWETSVTRARGRCVQALMIPSDKLSIHRDLLMCVNHLWLLWSATLFFIKLDFFKTCYLSSSWAELYSWIHCVRNLHRSFEDHEGWRDRSVSENIEMVSWFLKTLRFQ